MKLLDDIEPDEFWKSFPIPYQDSDDDYDFVNAVTVSREFMKIQADMAYFSGLAEVLTKQIASKQVELNRVERDLALLRRKVLAENYKEMNKSARPEIQEAFILRCVQGTQDETLIKDLENQKDSMLRYIEEREPSLDIVKSRMKAIERKMEYTTQFLNFEKLLHRVTEGRR